MNTDVPTTDMAATEPAIEPTFLNYFFPAYYSKENLLPQSQTPDQLSAWLQNNHTDYNLNSWCVYGRLGDMNDDAKAFFIMQQYYESPTEPTLAANGVKSELSAVGYNAKSNIGNPNLGGYLLGATSADNSFHFKVRQNPWSITAHTASLVENESLHSLISVSLLSGKMGEKGARYQLTTDAYCIKEGGVLPGMEKLTAVVVIEDKMGAINQGVSSAGFAPATLSKEVQHDITQNYGGNLVKFFENSDNTKQIGGTYNYSMPMWNVESYAIHTQSGDVVESGTSGNMWVDMMVGTNNMPKHVKSAEWLFYAIPLFEEVTGFNGSITTTKMTTTEDSGEQTDYANAFFAADHPDAPRHPNGSLKQATGTIGKVKYSIVNYWTSLVSGNKYPKEVSLSIEFDDAPFERAELVITPLWDDQEVAKGMNLKKDSNYEGLVSVKGILVKDRYEPSFTVNTVGWCEVSPSGKNS